MPRTEEWSPEAIGETDHVTRAWIYAQLTHRHTNEAAAELKRWRKLSHLEPMTAQAYARMGPLLESAAAHLQDAAASWAEVNQAVRADSAERQRRGQLLSS